MRKRIDYLSYFGEDETIEQKLERVEKSLEEKDKLIASLKADKELLEKKVNSLKIDGLVKKVEPKVKVEEEIQFDFDL